MEHFFAKENLYPELKDIEITDDLPEFYSVRKHYLIFTEAGKPVYTRYGEEMTLAPFFATLSAIIPKINSYFWNNTIHAKDQTNRLRWIEGGAFVCAIVKKGNFLYVCLYNHTQDSTLKFLDENKEGAK